MTNEKYVFMDLDFFIPIEVFAKPKKYYNFLRRRSGSTSLKDNPKYLFNHTISKENSVDV